MPRTLIMIVAALSVLVASTAAQAHYPYDLIPGFWAETLGPSATANPDCQISEVMFDDEDGTHWVLRTRPYEGDLYSDIPCGQVWGPASQQVRCQADLRSIHYSSGREDVVARVSCGVVLPRADGILASQCDGSFRYEDYGFPSGPNVSQAWTPYDCRADILPGWPTSPFGEPAPRAESRTATCSVRRCKYEAACVNSLGIGSCEVDAWLESRFQEIASAKPTQIGANAAGPVTLKTTPFGRALIKRTLEKGKRKMTGQTIVFDPSLPDPEFLEEKIKIKIKGKRR